MYDGIVNCFLVMIFTVYLNYLNYIHNTKDFFPVTIFMLIMLSYFVSTIALIIGCDITKSDIVNVR